MWDSPPIVINLKDAFLGFPSDPRWGPAASELIQKFTVDNNGSLPQPGSEVIQREESIQKLIYGRFVDMHFACDPKDLLIKRIRNLFAPHALNFETHIQLDTCFEVLRTMRTADSMRVMKTWVNGWATTYRYHEPTLYPCLFGCHAKPDDLKHYVQCSHLFAMNKFIRGHVSDDPLVRLGLVHPSADTCNNLVCVFAGYHAMRCATRRGDHSLQGSELCNRQVWRLWSVFAEAYSAEARELAISTRKFSLPQFLSCLIDDDDFR